MPCVLEGVSIALVEAVRVHSVCQGINTFGGFTPLIIRILSIYAASMLHQSYQFAVFTNCQAPAALSIQPVSVSPRLLHFPFAIVGSVSNNPHFGHAFFSLVARGLLARH